MRRSLPTRYLSVLSALWVTIALIGCAELSPSDPDAQRQSAALQQQQDAQAVQAASQATGRRVWFAGFAMNSLVWFTIPASCGGVHYLAASPPLPGEAQRSHTHASFLLNFTRRMETGILLLDWRILP